jgi:RNA 3'-terminal phosphate cyclase (ATP)
VRAIGELCQGSLEGARVGARELLFHPGRIPRGGSFQWDIGTAGSTTMLALALLPIAAFAEQPCTFRLTGGLFQDFAPSAFHLQNALLPLLERMGIKAALRILRPGYVPTGGGTIELEVEPVRGKLNPLVLLERRDGMRYWGIALSSHLKGRRVSQRMADACLKALGRRGLQADIRILYDDTAPQPGAALALFAEGQGAILGADQAGALHRSAESIGEFVARSLLEDLDSGATVDRHLADQLIIFAALAEGTSEFLIPRLTEHIQTNIWLVETILGAQAQLDGQVLRVRGVGYERH